MDNLHATEHADVVTFMLVGRNGARRNGGIVSHTNSNIENRVGLLSFLVSGEFKCGPTAGEGGDHCSDQQQL